MEHVKRVYVKKKHTGPNRITIGVRLLPHEIDALESFRAQHLDKLTRSDAIRHLLAYALTESNYPAVTRQD